jgi:hypothetical protein
MPGQGWLTATSPKVSLIFYSVSVALLIAVAGSTEVTVLDASDFLGTVSKLPPIYWLSIALIVAGIWLAYRVESISLCVFGCVLLAAGLYTVYGFIEPAGRHIVSYEASSLARRFIAGDLRVPSLPYSTYLGFPIVVTALIEVTGCSLLSLIRFFVPVWAVVLALLAFVFFRRVSGQARTAVLATALFVPLMGWHFFFVPQFVTYILLPAFLAAFCAWLDDRAGSYAALSVIILVSMIATHVLAPIVVIVFLIAFGVAGVVSGGWGRARRALGISVILGVLGVVVIGYLVWLRGSEGYFLGWTLPQILEAFKSPSRLLQALLAGQTIAGGSFTKQVQNLSQGIPFLVSVGLSVAFVVIAWRRKLLRPYRLPVLYFCSAIVMVLVPYGGDMGLTRVGYFIMLGAAPLSALLLARVRRDCLVFVLIGVLALVHPLAYSGSSGVTVVTQSELAGMAFLADKTDRDAPYFSQTMTVVYHDPYQFERRHYWLWSPPVRDFDVDEPFVYLLYSKRDRNDLEYYLGYDPIINSMGTINSTFNLVYANGNSLLYDRVYGH